MQDDPPPVEILSIVSDFLRREVVPALSGRQSFHARVAANALDLVRRQIQYAADGEAAELARLRAIFDAPQSGLAELNARLMNAIASGEINLTTPGVRDHLWRTTLEKLAVDQPGYAGYRRTLEELGREAAGD